MKQAHSHSLNKRQRRVVGGDCSCGGRETHLPDPATRPITAEQLINDVDTLPVYVDGADEIDASLAMIKGGGGALTREKIVAAVATKFVCICDSSKKVDCLGRFPLPVEVIPMARAQVTRQLARLAGKPVLREGFVTDNGNLILDVHGLQIHDPINLETKIDGIVGVVSNGLFAKRGADVLLLATSGGVEAFERI